MKKVLAIVLSLVMVLSLATAAFAAKDKNTDPISVVTTPGTNAGIAWYEMPVAYTVVYPDEIEVLVDGNTPDTAALTIQDAYIESRICFWDF